MARVIDLTPADESLTDEIAQLMFTSFQKYSPEWLPDLARSRVEIMETFDSGRRSRVLLDDDGQLLGWIGAIEDDYAWEIHPIVVSLTGRRKGYGKLLVNDIINLARAAGAVSIWAGTGDETHSTSFSTIDLYQHAGEAIQAFEAPGDHPVTFWSGIGFSVVGVLPDGEGLGKPEVHFSLRITSPSLIKN
tara:strand:+ start:38361 stop:38930 length:570 start_codon:yes stop_codon:yes gene_type:complete